MSEVITSTSNSQSEEMFQNKLLASMLENERKRICGLIGTTDDNTCPAYVNCPYREDFTPIGEPARSELVHCLLKRCGSAMNREVQHEQI